MKYLNTSFITLMKVVGALYNLKGSTSHSNFPSVPLLNSSLVKNFPSLYHSKRSSIIINGYLYLMIILFNALQSMHILHDASLFGTRMIGEPQGEVLSLITPYYSSSQIFHFTSSFSILNCLYKLIFKRAASCINQISCWMSLIGGRPFGFKNNSPYLSSNI